MDQRECEPQNLGASSQSTGWICHGICSGQTGNVGVHNLHLTLPVLDSMECFGGSIKIKVGLVAYRSPSWQYIPGPPGVYTSYSIGSMGLVYLLYLHLLDLYVKCVGKYTIQVPWILWHLPFDIAL